MRRNRGENDAVAAFAIYGTSGASLRLVDVSTPPVKSRAASRRISRKSMAVGGCAYVLHPEPATRSQFDIVLRELGLEAVDFEDEEALADGIRAERPEIVLWGIPHCSADDLDRIARVADGEPLPIVVVASLGDDVTLEEVHNAGACDLVLLPIPCNRLAPALSLALLRYEALQLLHCEHDEDENRCAARSLVWRAAAVWSKRRGVSQAEALQHILNRCSGRHLTRTAMEVVAEGLFP